MRGWARAPVQLGHSTAPVPAWGTWLAMKPQLKRYKGPGRSAVQLPWKAVCGRGPPARELCWGRRAEHRGVTSSCLQAPIALGDSKIFSNITWLLRVN